MAQNSLDMFYPVGSYYETSETTFNPNVAWGGSWSLLTNMDVTLSTTSNSDVTGGENSVTLTTSTIPSHRHYANIPVCKVGAATGDYWDGRMTSKWNQIATTGTGNTYGPGYTYWKSTGGSSAHNNMQPYIQVYRWRRDS